MQLRIQQLERQLNDGLVITVHWDAIKSQDGHTARVYGSYALPAKDPSDPSFIPFDNLTEEIVLGWLQDAMGEEAVAQLESSLDAQLNALINPVVASGLPWSNDPMIGLESDVNGG